MAAVNQPGGQKLDRYIIIHVATTCDEHGVYVTKDSAEVIEIGWILIDAKTLDEVGEPGARQTLAPSSRDLLGLSSSYCD